MVASISRNHDGVARLEDKLILLPLASPTLADIPGRIILLRAPAIRDTFADQRQRYHRGLRREATTRETGEGKDVGRTLKKLPKNRRGENRS